MHNKENFLDKLYKETNLHEEKHLSRFATKNSEAYRIVTENEKLLREPFAVDRDRIIYTGAYRRYQGKTQVVYFSNLFDEEMSNRSLHTTYVAQVSRNIGRMLRLNLDLIEAIAFGHDLGHPPFSHDGEQILNECCLKYGIGRFHHNIESLFIVDYITNHGKGLNLTFQVRDGIVSHDGEVHDEQLHPKRDKTEKDLQEFLETMKSEDTTSPPATLEACVVRISDTIAYIGQDIEDAIRMGFLNREELPIDAVHKLGSTNDEILSTLITNVIYNSYDKDYVAFDTETSDALYELKRFNYKKIYNHPWIKKEKFTIRRGMKILFDKFITDLEKKQADSKIFNHFLNHKSEQYIKDTNNAEKVRDFVATMTDRYFNQELEDYILPGRALE